MKTIMNMLMAGAAITMTSLPSIAGIQYDAFASAVIIEHVDEQTGEATLASDSVFGLGTALASTDTSPNSTGWSGLGMLADGSGFQYSGGFQHEEIDDVSTSFQFRAENVIEFTLDTAMQWDYSFVMDVNGVDLDHGYFGLENADGAVFNLGVYADHSSEYSYTLAAGDYKLEIALLGQSMAGATGSGGLSWDMSMQFSAFPGPGALALLGLAGIASRRRRR